jgi:transposase InsO family protein
MISYEDGRSYPLFNVVDDCNREGLGIDVDVSLRSERFIGAVTQIIEWRGKPSQIRYDNGPEYIDSTLIVWAENQGIKLVSIQSSNLQQGAYTPNVTAAPYAMTGWPNTCVIPLRRFRDMQRNDYEPIITHGQTWPSGVILYAVLLMRIRRTTDQISINCYIF